MYGLPAVAVIVGACFWFTTGRYVSTDDAYVGQDMVTISSDISGRITSVNVAENQRVNAGDVLFTFDDVPYKLALQNAQANVTSAVTQVRQLKAAHVQAQADLHDAIANLTLQQKAFDRISSLAPTGAASQSQLDTATYNLKAAKQRLATAQSNSDKTLAALQDDPDIASEDHALVQAALAKLGQAQVDMSHTIVVAPSSGTIAQTGKLQVGQYLQPATAVMSLVKNGDTWVDANFKETDLTYMRVGQPATVEIDAYPGQQFKATVASFGAGTGAQFSLLPAQNATGNWVKVVQRVPVRLHLQLPQGLILQTGLSVSAEVDTGHDRLYRYLSGDSALPVANQTSSSLWLAQRPQ
jgi:membrane fusion protein (multidrug efflux system)